MSAEPFYTRHRGPFHLVASRPGVKGKSADIIPDLELLSGDIDGQDVAELASMLLTDPLDTVTVVYVWSAIEGAHVMTYRKEASVTISDLWGVVYAASVKTGLAPTEARTLANDAVAEYQRCPEGVDPDEWKAAVIEAHTGDVA